MSAAVDAVYLDAWLAPFASLLADPTVTDIVINRPGELWVDRLGRAPVCEPAPDLSSRALERLSRQIAAASHQAINRGAPLLSASLPGGERVQIVGPPATRDGTIVAIRKQVLLNQSLADYAVQGSFAGSPSQTKDDAALRALAGPGRQHDFLALAVRQRRNILVSGGTSTGKTTFLNALLKEVPDDERLVVIEDTPELIVPQPNAALLLARRSPLGEAEVSADDLLSAALRLRPDRIILGEIRGPEAFTFLRAVNTGHPGSMTTVHADTPDRAVEQLALLVLQAGSRLSREDVRSYVEGIVDVYVQLARFDGRRVVSEVRLAQRFARAA
ncbi:P-type DNA transfer ATPase VirB11 [Sphingomonas sp. ASV193]|uniref:P-type DNA transfer ATPase VirB11 n=1 Tax=Sphingomonas sp. ASV193 TaxID=3144405 RepID=UPI0032E8D5C0